MRHEALAGLGGDASLDVFTAAPWQKMAQEARLGWPLIRERIEALCRKLLETLQDPAMRGAVNGDMEARVAALAQDRASAMLRNLTR